jgi:acyl carrier protein
MTSTIRLDLESIFVKIFEKSITEIKSWTYDSVKEWDSLTQIELVLTIEEFWKIKIEPRDIPFLETFDDFLQYLSEHVN